jgi:CheY-like chemotaxis protein
MIRSFEKTHPTHVLSERAALNGRIPIIAVSASLIEKERKIYVDAGFDGWILKPISFPRLQEIMVGIVDNKIRDRNIYRPGDWEKGGWFDKVQPGLFAANTAPDAQKQPMSDPSDGVKVAAVADDPQIKEDDDSKQTKEQQRMAAEQHAERGDDNPHGDQGPQTGPESS